ncbi:SMI1/KNR4 family protein [Streptacidiphilus anmyonensis]|uniref:SMI1/KNR4 family protein n=1 Tax=Streptacidiphilus anmyonensis TaxID=405782 RepID=UPI001364894E|nr:SMI1/KNR4 family protein [Streptacidiphilus anmyonensis]
MIHPPRNLIDAVIPPVSESWRRIDAWLGVHAPASFAGLNPPATPDAIARTESVFGMPLPRDLCESLLCHDGETRFGTALPCSQLLSAEEIVAARRMRMELWEPEDPDQAETPWWGEHWVPFAGDVSLSFIEAGPGIWHDHLGRAPHDDGAGFLGWPTLGTWLHHVAEAMERFDQHFAHRVEPPKLRRNGTLDWW